MPQLMNEIASVTAQMAVDVIAHYRSNWIPLCLAILVAAAMRAHLDPARIRLKVSRRPHLAIWGSVALGAFTPLCACGTAATVVGMLGAALPWGAVMAFLTSSPLMSPDGFIMLAGVVGMPFAAGMLVSSIAIGLGSGYLTHAIETRTTFLRGQSRFTLAPVPSCACGTASLAPSAPTTSAGPRRLTWRSIEWKAMGQAIVDVGLRQMLPFYTLFLAIGFLINRFVPTSVIVGLFGDGNVAAVPIAALIGLPLYVTGESAVPLVRSLLAEGASGGAMIAFMITGAATSAWVIAGFASFIKARPLALYVGLILVGGIASGYAYDLAIAFFN
ncbi:MAG TPA: permease [Treponemataceae bacterium]|nr:permease [Treponemataceae bacterium]